MLRENIDIKTISLVTGLTSDDILKLKNKLLTHRTHKTLKSNERIKNKVAKV